ncbi:hypothetical protein B0H14DRAFT_2577756 [Mycena olivaceomarginata]|nr:hypothetical protein B0H14DRAFT_2577756 [Mycena olivaceomarginata]
MCAIQSISPSTPPRSRPPPMRSMRRVRSERIWWRAHTRMERHVIRVLDHDKARFWVVPLQASSPQLHDALRALTKRIPADSAIVSEIDRILDDTVDVLQIHEVAG